MKQIAFCLLLAITFFAADSQPLKDELNSFFKPEENPILRGDSSLTFMDPIKKTTVMWQSADVFNPAAIIKDNKVFLLYRCEDNPSAILGGRTSRIGLAESEDGIHFKKFPTPVLYPDNDEFMQFDYPGGCEDPRLVETEDGLYVMSYTAWNYKTPRLSIAFSKDLVHWEKKGPAFLRAYQGKFRDIASKSGSIITKFVKQKIIAAKIRGKYWMYWGEHFINLAWSDNLIDWNPLLDSKGSLKAFVRTRTGKFDSDLTECGPPAILLDKGIVLLFNGRNATNDNADPMLPKGMYSVGQAVFDKDNPENLLDRSDSCFIKPTLPHERTGQYQSGTTFAEGLVYFKGKWFLYYGTADSFVGLAISN
jgi:beta-1,2-mannosidase